MEKEIWRIWDKDHSVEQRTFKRVTGELPEMESSKQLVGLISKVYESGMRILDVGCAAGHYYNSVKRVGENVNYYGIDATKAYIEFARDYFKDNPNANFERGDIFNLNDKHKEAFDIVYCCNVILHLPSFQVPIENLLKVSKKYVFVRTLLSNKTHLSKFLYSDQFDSEGTPLDYVHQNTYSFDLFKSHIESLGDYSVEFIEDKFDIENINKEYKNYQQVQDAVTVVQNGVQIAGSKVFEWHWVKVTKN